jgi:hypothetical protein
MNDADFKAKKKSELDNIEIKELLKLKTKMQDATITSVKNILGLHDDWVKTLEGVTAKQGVELDGLPFKVRYEIGQVLLRDNPSQAKEISEWIAKGRRDK